MIRWVRSVFLGVVATVLAFAGGAGADSLRIRTEGPARPLITLHGDGRVLKRCVGGCSTEVERGRYRIVVSATPGTYAYEDDVEVNGATDVRIEPGDKGNRRGLIVAGWTMIGLSIPLFVLASFYELSDNIETGYKGHVGGLTVASGSLFLGGVVCAAAASTMKPGIVSRPSASAAIVPTTAGAIAVGSFTF